MNGERWIVDAMNVIGSRADGWWHDRDAAMREFARAVVAYAAATGKDITVVFDSDPGHAPETPHIEDVTARRRGPNVADHEIERLVMEDQDPTRLRVVTSDRVLVDTVTSAGARVVSSGTFRQEFDPHS